MIYLYLYLAICCICYYFVYQQILWYLGSIDQAVALLRDSIKYEYGEDFADQYTHIQLKRLFYVVVFLVSPWLLMTGVFR